MVHCSQIHSNGPEVLSVFRFWQDRIPDPRGGEESIGGIEISDYISREAAVEQCKRHSDYTAWSIKDGIEAIPAADVEPVRHGKWNIRVSDERTLCLE